jgi:ketosteroid isomerase-like protein
MKALVLVSALLLAAAIPGGAQAQSAVVQPPTIELPPELDRVLRDYESAWQARNPEALAACFTEDGFVMARGRPPVHGREAIREHYTGSGGPLSLRSFAYAIEGSVGYILGGYSAAPGLPDDGKFTLTLRRAADGRWLNMSDMDNGNR